MNDKKQAGISKPESWNSDNRHISQMSVMHTGNIPVESHADNFAVNSPYGKWATDEAGLPCFDLNPEATTDIDAPLIHLMSTGVMTGRIDRWGDLRLMTSGGGEGQKSLRVGTFHSLSDILLSLETESAFHSLHISQWDQGRTARWGVGYARFEGYFTRPSLKFRIIQEIVMPWNDSPGALGLFTITNESGRTISAKFRICAQIAGIPESSVESKKGFPFEGGDGWVHAEAIHPSLKKTLLVGPNNWQPSREYISLVLSNSITLQPGETLRFSAWAGCTFQNMAQVLETARELVKTFVPLCEKQKWAKRLAATAMIAPAHWITEECQWTAGQLLAFTGLDGSRGEKIIHIGGYAWNGFPVRECAETAMILAPWQPDLAHQSMIWLAKNQLFCGDLPKSYCFNGILEELPHPWESDNEIWFLLAIGEMIDDGFAESIFDVSVPYANGGLTSFWEHAKAAWRWIRDDIGCGPHGLVKIWYGDWDDYLNSMGRLGKGESTMNTGMACRALDHFAVIAHRRGEDELAAEVKTWTAERRKAMETTAFDETHFLRGFNDCGEPVGSHAENRIHLNAQTWAVLGGCGTPKMRRTAMKTMLRECWSPIGLTLISHPYAAPAPPNISRDPIPAGEGENGGIWPQTVHWAVWALAETGMLEEAQNVWIRMSLRNHVFCHPNVPYGIWNGPDCYSSHFAGLREGRTQCQLIDRFRDGVPINPAVAWQAFSWRKLSQAMARNI